MSKEIGITVKKNEDFSEWYTQVVLKAELADYAAAKGFMILRPYGYAIWEKIREILDSEFERTGHRNAYFPSLIPESLLSKEAEHFKGFTPEVFWVTQTGDNPLSERLAVRPTSETITYDSYAKWIRSWRDLPLLLNYWNSVLRAEIKSTKPFIRTSEFLWQEGHTVHATEEEANEEVLRMLKIYQDFIEKHLAIPVLVGRKTDKEKFVGALYTTTLEAVMPDGKVLQMGTSHNLGQNFSKAFGIKYLGKDKMEHYAWQTCWGVSWRLIGATIMVHSDDKGLVLPPRVAPIQVVIIPIHYGEKDRRRVMEKVGKVSRVLKRMKLGLKVDDREEYTPGWKFNEYELKGVPLRMEIGPRDVERGQVTLVRRDTGRRMVVEDGQMRTEVRNLLDDIQRNLYLKAKAYLTEHITTIHTYDEFKDALEKTGGFVRASWCAEITCEEKIKEETGADIRLIPLQDEAVFSNCIRCGKEAKCVAYFGRAY